MAFDLNSMSLKELKDLQGQVSKAIATFEDRKKKQALAELEEKARQMGFSLAELTGTSAPANAHPLRPNMPIRQMRGIPGPVVAATALVCRCAEGRQTARGYGSLI